MVQYLINSNPEIMLPYIQTSADPLIYAAQHGYMDILKELIELGAHVNAQTEVEGRTALMFSLDYSNRDTLEFLIRQGASLDLQDWEGRTAIDYARELVSMNPHLSPNPQQEVLEYLLHLQEG
jgi:ankyrin repeat protein